MKTHCECGTPINDVEFIEGTRVCAACSQLAAMSGAGANPPPRIRTNDDGITPKKLAAAYREYRP